MKKCMTVQSAGKDLPHQAAWRTIGMSIAGTSRTIANLKIVLCVLRANSYFADTWKNMSVHTSACLKVVANVLLSGNAWLYTRKYIAMKGHLFVLGRVVERDSNGQILFKDISVHTQAKSLFNARIRVVAGILATKLIWQDIFELIMASQLVLVIDLRNR